MHKTQLPLFYSFPLAMLLALSMSFNQAIAKPKVISAELAPILEKGYNQLKDGNNNTAVSTLKSAIKVDEDSITARRYYAYALIKDQKPVDAIKQLNLIVNKINKPTYFEWCTFGEAYLAAGGVQQAQNCFEQALKVAPSSYYVKSGLIRTNVKSGNFKEALELAKQGMKNSKTPETYDYFKRTYGKVRAMELAQGGDSSIPIPQPSTSSGGTQKYSAEYVKQQRAAALKQIADSKARQRQEMLSK